MLWHAASPPVAAVPLPERIRQLLAAAPGPLSLATLRDASRLRKSTLCQVLAEMTDRGVVRRFETGGYRLTSPPT